MARRIFLYIGLPKTGTTFIQTTMWHNRAALRRQGLLYPGRSRFDHFHASQELRTKPEVTRGRLPVWQSLAAAAANFDGDVLITHEFFSMFKPAQIRRCLASLPPAEIHVVVTVRSYVLQWPAVWQEGLKMFVDQSFDTFMADALENRLQGAWGWRSQNIPQVLHKWSAEIPADRIHVITVPPPGSPRNLLWDRWTETTGIDDTRLERDVAFANSSLGAPQAALLHALKPRLSEELLDGATRHRWVRQYFGHEVLVPQQGPRFGTRPDVTAELVRRSRAAARTIRREGYDVVGDLGDLRYQPPDPEVPPPYPDDVTTEQMLEVALDAIEQMIRDHRAATLERDALRAKLSRRTPSRASLSRSLSPRRRNVDD
ncbi:MAG: hypothetical protein QM655_07070 [Nocardioidaceae bacterium]